MQIELFVGASDLRSDGQPLRAELLVLGTTTSGQVSKSVGSLSLGGSWGGFEKDHTAHRLALLTFPPASAACCCWEWSLGLHGPLA